MTKRHRKSDGTAHPSSPNCSLQTVKKRPLPKMENVTRTQRDRSKSRAATSIVRHIWLRMLTLRCIVSGLSLIVLHCLASNSTPMEASLPVLYHSFETAELSLSLSLSVSLVHRANISIPLIAVTGDVNLTSAFRTVCDSAPRSSGRFKGGDMEEAAPPPSMGSECFFAISRLFLYKRYIVRCMHLQ